MSADSSLHIELLTIPEVAEMLKVSKSSVRRLIEQRVIAFAKVGGSIRFNMHDVESYLEKVRVEAADQI
jgi:excisionase family DNA binding protein